MKKIICLILAFCAVLCSFALVSCTTSSTTVNHNISVKADNFEVMRRITVYNARTDTIILNIEGYMSLSNNSNDELIVTCKVGDDLYKKNYVYLNDYTLYVVEDITGVKTDPYHYKVKFYTAMPDIDINE